ncbi:MAG: Ig-like domain-containing protein [Bacteroidia bacterium]|nr:Ig-like domain-containing protein [Bacteroidia bacterium]
MKNLTKKPFQLSLLAFVLILALGCERKISEDAVLPTFSTNGEIFTDNFIGLGSNFYFPFADAKPDVFSVDMKEGYNSDASIRIDVPNNTDPTGTYAGAIFRVDGAGRNLSGFDALTFYVKASTGTVLGDVGFGIDYLGDKYQVTVQNTNVGTNWTKVIVPIPDPTKLVNERGVFWFAAGTQATNGLGYTLWFDDIRFEKLGTVGKPTSSILNGQTTSVKSFIGSTINVTGLSHVYNLVTGRDVRVISSAAYYNFTSSNPTVATVNDRGVVSALAIGTAEITANINGVSTKGKLILECKGDLVGSPIPTRPASDVKSIFSDAYTDATISNFTPGFGGSTTITEILTTSTGKVAQYSNNNYTGIMFTENPVDATMLGFLHIDAYVENAATSIGIQIRDIGSNKTIETDVNTGNPMGDDRDVRTTLSGFQTGVWKSFDIPLNGGILNQKGNIGALIITGGPNFILDNIYFYK